MKVFPYKKQHRATVSTCEINSTHSSLLIHDQCENKFHFLVPYPSILVNWKIPIFSFLECDFNIVIVSIWILSAMECYFTADLQIVSKIGESQ